MQTHSSVRERSSAKAANRAAPAVDCAAFSRPGSSATVR